jgi:PAS domain S-box-containing protein
MGIPGALRDQRRAFAVAAAASAGLTLVLALLLSDLVPLAVRQTASSVGLLLAGLIGMVSCAVRARQTAGRRRRSWRMFTVAAGTAIAANVVATAMGADPLDSYSLLADLGLAAAISLAIVGLALFPFARRRGIDLVLTTLDGLVAGIGVLVTAAVLVYSELFTGSSGPTSVLLPVLDVILVTVALWLLLRATGEDRPPLLLIAAGFISYGVADLAFLVLLTQGEFEFGTPLDLGWIVGYLLVSLAAWYPSSIVDEPPRRTAVDRVETRGTVLVFAVIVVAGIVQVRGGEKLHGAMAALWLLLVVAAGLRQWMLARDNASLRRGLERRVREQTADLHRLARETEVLLTSVGDGIYGVDTEGRITFVNPTAAAMLGESADDLLGAAAHDRFHSDEEGGHLGGSEGCYVTEAISTGAVVSGVEDAYVRADGGTFPVEITASPVVDAGEPRGAVVAFRDVTQRREVDRMKSEFLSVVSHELRTPLTSIRGSLGLLAGGALGELTPRARSMVAIAVQSSDRLTRLINDLLDLERIGSGARPMDIGSVAAADLVGSAVTQIEGMAAPLGVRVRTGECRGRVLADEDRIMQTLTNLLGNAVKYSEPGGLVTAEAVEQDGHVLFRVRDEGRGIPAEMLDSIFERFQQVDSSDSRQKGGTGLGLAISKTIVERHGGRIWAESEYGAGTTVCFTLPAVPTTRMTHDGPGDEPTVLICDDDGGIVAVFSTFLRRHGYRVTGVTDGEEALALARAHPPAVVLLDLLMPGRTGGQVLAGLRGDESTRAIPVVVVSAIGPEDEPGLVSEVDGWLVKPVTEEHLVSVVSRTVARTRGGMVGPAVSDGGGE